MLQEKLDRISELSRKSRTPEGLTDAEKLEQSVLRQEYRDGYTRNLTEQLENARIVEPDGSIHEIKPEKE